jgi:short-subunit dehydrogenase
LISLAESARVDLWGSGVSVVTICPGYVKSEMTAKHNPKKMFFLLETEDGARRILDGMRSKRRVVHFPWQLSFPMKYLVRLMPGFLYERVISLVGERVQARR